MQKDGKPVMTPANDNLLMLYSPLKNKYDSKLGCEDLDKMLFIKQNFKRFKNTKEFNNFLVVPPTVENKPQLKFYSRFESGNLLKAIKIPVSAEVNNMGIALKSTIKYEYDLYLE